MVPAIANTAAIVILVLIAGRLAEIYLPEGAINNGVHFVFK